MCGGSPYTGNHQKASLCCPGLAERARLLDSSGLVTGCSLASYFVATCPTWLSCPSSACCRNYMRTSQAPAACLPVGSRWPQWSDPVFATAFVSFRARKALWCVAVPAFVGPMLLKALRFSPSTSGTGLLLGSAV